MFSSCSLFSESLVDFDKMIRVQFYQQEIEFCFVGNGFFWVHTMDFKACFHFDISS